MENQKMREFHGLRLVLVNKDFGFPPLGINKQGDDVVAYTTEHCPLPDKEVPFVC